MSQAFLSYLVDKKRGERGEDATNTIKKIIQREEVHGVWRFTGKVLVKVKNVSMTKLMATAGGSLVEKPQKQDNEKEII